MEGVWKSVDTKQGMTTANCNMKGYKKTKKELQ